MAHATVSSSVEVNGQDKKNASENIACTSMDHSQLVSPAIKTKQFSPPDGGWGYTVTNGSAAFDRLQAQIPHIPVYYICIHKLITFVIFYT